MSVQPEQVIPPVLPNQKAWDVGQEENLLDPYDAKDKGQQVVSCTSGLFPFSNIDDIKRNIRAAKLEKEPYDVRNYYHKTGIFQAIARNEYFENITLGVIVLNAIWISVDTDNNVADTFIDALPMFVVADTLFFTYFASELFIRFMAFKHKYRCFQDFWFVFDMLLVGLYAFDPFVIGMLAAASGGGGLNLPTSILRLLRLARLSRLVRMLRSLPELMIMIKGMLTATTSVGYTLGLLMVIDYVFAIALRNLVPKDSGIEEDYLSSVPEAMHNLIIFATFTDDLSAYIVPVKEESTACLILSWLFIGLTNLTVMNMLIGVLCEVIAAVAEQEKEGMMVDKMKEKFTSIIHRLDSNHDGVVSWEEFQKIMEMPEALIAMDSVNIDAESFVDIAEEFFLDEKEYPFAIDFEQFMSLLLDCRGGMKASVKDVMSMGKRFSGKFLRLHEQLDSLEIQIARIMEKIRLIAAKKGIILPAYTMGDSRPVTAGSG
jgi:hypothetical protein